MSPSKLNQVKCYRASVRSKIRFKHEVYWMVRQQFQANCKMTSGIIGLMLWMWMIVVVQCLALWFGTSCFVWFWDNERLWDFSFKATDSIGFLCIFTHTRLWRAKRMSLWRLKDQTNPCDEIFGQAMHLLLSHWSYSHIIVLSSRLYFAAFIKHVAIKATSSAWSICSELKPQEHKLITKLYNVQKS